MADLKADDTGNAIVPVLACVLNQLCLRNDRVRSDTHADRRQGADASRQANCGCGTHELTVLAFHVLLVCVQLPMSQKGLSKFHALRPPAISIKDYLQRVAKYAACSGECFVLALVYIDRIIQSNPTFVVNSLNIHRLLITSIMLAAKFFDDQYFNNAYYAKVGGVPCNEINSLEVEFLFMCNFTLFVTTDTYSQYYTELCNHAVNIQNVCNCSQGPKVPSLVIPYVNSPGPGQTIAEWHMQQSSNIPYHRNDGADIELTEQEMQQYALQQQAALQQQQAAYEQQQQQQQSQPQFAPFTQPTSHAQSSQPKQQVAHQQQPMYQQQQQQYSHQPHHHQQGDHQMH
jgi:hypothetical protein